MKKRLFFFILIFLAFPLHNLQAKLVEKQFNYPDYKTALKAESHMHFDFDSTKVGIFKTTHRGVVKEFKIQADKKDNTVKDLQVSFPVLAMDSKKKKRDEKMHGYCLEHTKYPSLAIRLPGSITIGKPQWLSGTINVRGKDKPIKVKVHIQDLGEKYKTSGQSTVKLSELEIPDPSIKVAKMEDELRLSFQIILERTK